MINKSEDCGWVERSWNSPMWFCLALLIAASAHPKAPGSFLLCSQHTLHPTPSRPSCDSFKISGLDLTALALAFCLSSSPFSVWCLHTSAYFSSSFFVLWCSPHCDHASVSTEAQWPRNLDICIFDLVSHGNRELAHAGILCFGSIQLSLNHWG